MFCLYLLITVYFTALELELQSAFFGPEYYTLGVFITVSAKICCTCLGLRAGSTQSAPHELWRIFGTAQINRSSIGDSFIEGFFAILAYYFAWFLMSIYSSCE